MGMFLLGLFGMAGKSYNQARFSYQTRKSNLLELEKEHFNAHGGLSNPPIRLCDEVVGYDESDSVRLLTAGEMEKKELGH